MAAREELPRDVKGGQVKQWSDLPTLVAVTDMGATLPGLLLRLLRQLCEGPTT